MSFSVTLYGPLRRLVGARTLTVAGAVPATPAALKRVLAHSHPALEPHLRTCAVSMGDALLADDAPLDASGAIALLPPVSGG